MIKKSFIFLLLFLFLSCSGEKTTTLEAEEIVEPGELEPSQIHTPGIYVNRVIQGSFEKRIERRTVRQG